MLVGGTLVFDEEIRIPEVLDDCPAASASPLTVAADLNTLTWAGLGAHESYPDRPVAPARPVDEHRHRPVRPLPVAPEPRTTPTPVASR